MPAPPAVTFGVLPCDRASRQPWLDLPFPLEEFRGRPAQAPADTTARMRNDQWQVTDEGGRAARAALILPLQSSMRNRRSKVFRWGRATC